jgi:hypothetical protein
VLHLLYCSPHRTTPLGPFPSLSELCTGQEAICTSSSLYIVIAHAPRKHPDSFSFIPRISKILRAGTTHYIVTSGRVSGVRPAVPPAANPVNPTCPSAEEVHAGKFIFQGLIRSSRSECGAWTEMRYRDRICVVELQNAVEREDVFLSMTRKLRIPCARCSVSIGTCDADEAKTFTMLSSSSCFRENA